MNLVNIGGVPEHFNLPWYLTLKNGEYKKEGINLRWRDYFGGTGEMAKDLRNGTLDLAVILTEGIVKDIVEGNSSKIVQVFVKSPLIWGIHAAGNSHLSTLEDLKGKKAAISRYGSGSHLMAFVNAENNGWDINTDLQFEVIKNLDGAVESLTEGKADYFMWEKFTTKPLVDDNTFKLIESCPTPWPCFVIAASKNFIENQSGSLKIILQIINNTTVEFKSIPSIDQTLANRYHQKLIDIQEWLSLTEWSQKQITQDQIYRVQDKLKSLGLISEEKSYQDFVHTFAL
ncbi:substrate-binding domain-containing protein [Paucihalobacter sp.]|uniref:substrate-binding domain-containing protein n=1 Tax=Paucihalobacter sp. TaxID=2850405 RepID=UPI002FE2C986